MHIFHKWTKWGKVNIVKMIHVSDDGETTVIPYTKRTQQRTCEKCGKIQERYVEEI